MRLLHTMLRVGNLERSLQFYTDVLDMRLLRKKEYPEGKFTLAFVGYNDESEAACIELTHNWDVDNYEFGFKLDLFEGRMRLNGAIFRTDLDNMQLRQVVLDSTDIPRVVLRNASESRIEGVELELTWTPIDDLLLIGRIDVRRRFVGE